MALGASVVFLPQVVPYSQCSDAYKKYANVEGIEATFIKDFRINDTVSVDVTVLEAVDTNAWNMLKNDCSLPVLDPVSQRKIDNGKDLIFTRLVNDDDFNEPADLNSPECDVIAISYLNHTIWVFHVKSMIERHAVLFYNLEKAIDINNKYHKKT